MCIHIKGREKSNAILQHFKSCSLQWKYQINIDGTVAAYRLPYLIAGDSVVLKQDSDYYEHFYKDLEPWVHYIPFNRDLSDLEEKLNWTINNDDKVQVLMYHDTKAMDVVLVE